MHTINSQPNSYAVKLAENMDLYKSAFSQCNSIFLIHLGPLGSTTMHLYRLNYTDFMTTTESVSKLYCDK